MNGTPPTLVVPAFEPPASLLDWVKQVRRYSSMPVLIVDDGSSPCRQWVFERLSRLPNTRVLRSESNRGKGAALKMAFGHYLAYCPDDSPGVVCADADGQHDPQDVLDVSRLSKRHPGHLVLGCRTLGRSVPWRNRLGNRFMRHCFALVTGMRIPDTQTGLRALPRRLVEKILRLEPDGFAYELEVLLYAIRHAHPLSFYPIRTLYRGEGSHFRPVSDSARILFHLLKGHTYVATVDRLGSVLRHPLPASPPDPMVYLPETPPCHPGV